METGLRGKVVIVTGATANIGRGVALAFAEEGARVVIVGRDRAAGELVVKLALERGASNALWRAADVTAQSEVIAMVAEVMARFGQIDVLVNNVGGGGAVSPFVSSTPEQWRFDIDLTLMTTLYCTHAVLPHMLAKESGRIVNIGSTAGVLGQPNLAVYSAAKGGVHAFTRVLALEVGASGITVNTIAPDNTRSEDPYSDISSGSGIHPETGVFTLALAENPEMLASMYRRAALNRQQARPAEIGAAAVYFASESAAFVTGQLHCVDGGVALV
jgi:2-hydroxycyclohexanecarboxyl-CoA dehydrogenase